jgi:hypothetical protein
MQWFQQLHLLLYVAGGTAVVTCTHTMLSCGLRSSAGEFQMYRCEDSDHVSCAVGKNVIPLSYPVEGRLR